MESQVLDNPPAPQALAQEPVPDPRPPAQDAAEVSGTAPAADVAPEASSASPAASQDDAGESQASAEDAPAPVAVDTGAGEPPEPAVAAAPPADGSSQDVSPSPRRFRPEHVMGLIAIFAAVLLLIMVVLCLPYFRPQRLAEEDPENLPQFRGEVTEPPRETILEPTVPETEPENPTIPPDANPYSRYDFQYNRNNYLLLQNVKSYPGIDVSAHQGSIDWQAVAGAGIDFAIIRLGYRGYGSGKLVEDDYARQNLTGAKEAGLNIGAYFFSQALNIQEVDEEIAFMLNILGEQYLDMPIILDWEIPASDARTANMDGRTLTDIQLYFCQEMEARGYQPMVYFNWYQSEHLYYLSELEDYPFWLALYQDRMTYPWKVEMWQYSDHGSVPGISGAVDLNVYMPN